MCYSISGWNHDRLDREGVRFRERSPHRSLLDCQLAVAIHWCYLCYLLQAVAHFPSSPFVLCLCCAFLMACLLTLGLCRNWNAQQRWYQWVASGQTNRVYMVLVLPLWRDLLQMMCVGQVLSAHSARVGQWLIRQQCLAAIVEMPIVGVDSKMSLSPEPV